MKTFKRLMVLLVTACFAAACGTLSSAPSYELRSPFPTMKGQ